MVFLIGEKLDFLMKLTSTHNSTLGRALNFDASYISRIRNGRRGVPKHQPFLEEAAVFFAEKLTEPYQQRIAAETVCPGQSWPESRQEAAELLHQWLRQGEQSAEREPVAQFLSGLSGLRGPALNPPAEQTVPREEAQTRLFYGNEGKRQAVLCFLEALTELTEPPELLLWSDEEMSWLYEDNEFTRRWGALLTRLLSAGATVRIVHNVTRNDREMLEAVRRWLPLYLSGAIESWYCPAPRDGILHRTLFLARGHSALFANSVGRSTRGRLNVLVYAKEAVAALEAEFQDYFSLCSPLMEVCAGDPMRFAELLHEGMAAEGNLWLSRALPSLFSLPESVGQRLAARGLPWLESLRRASAEQARRRLERGETITELLRLPPPEELTAGWEEPLAPLLGQPPARFTGGELLEHLRGALALARSQRGYRVLLTRGLPDNVLICALEGQGILAVRTGAPGAAFRIREEGLSGAFLDYLRRSAGRAEHEGASLEAYIAALERRLRAP